MSRIASIPTLRRPERTYGNVNLNNTGTKVRIPVTAGQAVTLYSNLEFGTWATATAEVKQRSGTNPVARSFASAKTIAAGGGVLRFSSSEMAAVDELEFQVTLAEGGAATAMLHVVHEVPVQTVQLAQQGGTTGGGGGVGAIVPGGTDGADGSDIVIT